MRAGPVGDIARTARKFRLGLVLATPDIASLKKGEVDLAPELLSVMNTVISFRMTWPDDVKTIAEFLYAQNIDFTRLVHEVERRAGPIWIPVDEWSESYNRQTATGRTSGSTLSNGQSSQETSSRGTQQNGTSSFDPSGQIRGTARGTGVVDGHATAKGRTQATTEQNGRSDTETEGSGITISHKLVHLERIVREIQKTGVLEKAVSDQLARFTQQISGQSNRRATVRVREGKAVIIETVEVKDPFCSAEANAKAVDWIKRELYQAHDYYFTPTLDTASDDERLADFLAGSKANNTSATHRSRNGSQATDCSRDSGDAHPHGSNGSLPNETQSSGETPFI